MDLKHLRTFRAIAELGSLSKAADKLRIAQPALSRQIKLLEQEVRAELFVREGRGMSLTAAGRHLLDRTSEILRQIDQIRNDLQSFDGVPTGKVVLGFVPTVSSVLTARIARSVMQRLPGVTLRILESYTGHLLEWLHKGEIDIAVIYGRDDELHVAAEVMGREQLVAIGAKNSALSGVRSVDFEQFAQLPLALPSKSHGLRTIVENAAERKGLKVNCVLEADSFRVLTEIVEMGLGYSVLPLSAIRRELEQGRLAIAPVGNPALTRSLIAAMPLGSGPSIATSAVLDILREEATAAIADKTWELSPPPRKGKKGA